ncbi:MAG: hypothetical protein B0A82_23285 [Alkalinema sp. CACIAM 70d]|nr:MAG: hypothetical protein B0A82_23285 [Alkalinema sp. CACIAM 70d]
MAGQWQNRQWQDWQWRRSLLRSLKLMVLTIAAFWLMSLSACALPQIKATDRLFLPLSLDFLGEYDLPQDSQFEDTPVGGLSGITYDPQRDVFYAISDDRSEKAPARFYTLKINLDPASHLSKVDVQGVTFLQQADGEPYERRTIDTEGISLTPQGTVWISSEGVARDEISPFVNEFDVKTGKLLRKLFFPDYYTPKTIEDPQSKQTTHQGIQDNLGFEALTLSAGAARMGPTEPYRLFTATESALTQDAEPPTAETRAKARLLHYYVETGRIDLIAEYLYELEPAPSTAIRHGLCELLSLDPAGRFLSLERSLGLGGFQVKLFQMSFAGAKDTSLLPTVQHLPKVVKPVQKQALLDLNELGIDLDNLEGMTLGPRLPDGSPSLLLVSDNNFSDNQKTQFLLFRVKGLKPQ